MKQFHFLHALVPVLILVTHRGVFAVGRGPARLSSLGSEDPRRSATSAAYQGPSPAELEEQEEEDGSQDQALDQEGSPQAPVQMFTQPEVTAPAAVAPRPEISLSALYQTPAVPALGWAAEPKLSDQGSKAFLSYRDGQSQEALSEEPHAMRNSQATEAVEPIRGAAGRDGAHASSFDRQADLEALQSSFDRLAAKASSIPSLVQPEKTLSDAFTTSRSDAAFAKPFFPAALPQSMVQGLQTAPKNNFPAILKERGTCHPPCIQGRGICNDNICFCKTPFTGTTCQHKMSNYARIKYPMLVAASGVCVVFGLLFAQIIHGFVQRRVEKRLVWLGDGMVKQEIWMPPDNTKKKGAK